MPKSEPVHRPHRERAKPSPSSSTSRFNVPPAGPRIQPTVAGLMHLQHAAGNRAVQRLVNASRSAQPVQRIEAPVQRLGEEEEQGYTAYQPMTPARASTPPPAPPPPAAPSSGYGVYAAHALPAAAESAPAPASSPAAAAPAAAPVTGPGGLAPISLPAKYRGEDREVGWRASYGMPEDASPEMRARAEAVSHGTSIVTKYNTPEETARNTLTPRANAAGGKSLEYSGGGAASTAPVEYAMSPAGQVVANLGGSPSERVDGQRRNIHHSTMLAGGDVAHAGHIGVGGGQVNYLDDDSGHYRPDEAHTYAAFNELADQGVLNKDSAVGRVKMVDKTKTKGLDHGPDTSASVHFSGYQQAQGNEQAIRNRGAVMDELLQKRPRYEGPAAAADAGGGGGGMVYEPDDDALALAPDSPPAAASEVPPVYSSASGVALSAERVAAGAALPPPPAPAPAPAASSLYSPYSPYTPMPAAPNASAAVTPTAPTAAPMPPGYGMSAASTPAAPISAPATAPTATPAAASPYSPYSPYTPMPATPDPASVPPSATPSPPASPTSFLDEQL